MSHGTEMRPIKKKVIRSEVCSGHGPKCQKIVLHGEHWDLKAGLTITSHNAQPFKSIYKLPLKPPRKFGLQVTFEYLQHTRGSSPSATCAVSNVGE